jgi:hypothetical protein
MVKAAAMVHIAVMTAMASVFVTNTRHASQNRPSSEFTEYFYLQILWGLYERSLGMVKENSDP